MSEENGEPTRGGETGSTEDPEGAASPGDADPRAGAALAETESLSDVPLPEAVERLEHAHTALRSLLSETDSAVEAGPPSTES